MRLWSLHPKYLDAKGLVAAWRESLLAKNVLEEKTKGYRHHPQLHRFRECSQPLAAINFYMAVLYKEALKRDYNFDKTKFVNPFKKPAAIIVTDGQLQYEWQHLLKKLKTRDRVKYLAIRNEHRLHPHPLFKMVKGPVADWEIL
ncbi:MAG: hypothetical protein C4308_06320 [Chitinophagaceae bacterium]